MMGLKNHSCLIIHQSATQKTTDAIYHSERQLYLKPPIPRLSLS
jgi:hypothetical protein